MMDSNRRRLLGFAGGTAALSVLPVQAQDKFPSKPIEVVTPHTPEPPKQDVAVVENKRSQGKRIERPGVVAIRKQPLATRELAGTRADVIANTEPVETSTAFSIDASSIEYFKLSVDDGRGNAKTISVPTISFGSQRLMHNANQFAPKRAW